VLASGVDEQQAWKRAASAAMDRYANGDDQAFAELYDHLAPRIHAYFLRQTRNSARAEDLLQQTFLQMHCARRHFLQGAEVVPWAFCIARHLLIDGVRKQKHEVPLEADDELEDSGPPSTEAPPDLMAESKEVAGLLSRELERLPESQRVAFELIRHDGLSVAEAAEVLGTTVAAVKLRTHRTYVALRAVLGEIDAEPSGAMIIAQKRPGRTP
jgi:RNA polymerase sigma-70 factor (ECF subfamily)